MAIVSENKITGNLDEPQMRKTQSSDAVPVKILVDLKNSLLNL